MRNRTCSIHDLILPQDTFTNSGALASFDSGTNDAITLNNAGNSVTGWIYGGSAVTVGDSGGTDSTSSNLSASEMLPTAEPWHHGNITQAPEFG